ncbi:MAG: hypothetical protein JO210_13750 [Acidobacteriaceae bacterium]|nr:hypothetical protein [Acidobacteriaceae bacterium]
MGSSLRVVCLASMKRAAIGIRMHSGWGALVAASGEGAMLDIIERRRIIMADPNICGASQPYHFAAEMPLPEAKKHISNCANRSERLAVNAIQTVLGELHSREYRVVGSAVLLASGRPLPILAEILASHPLIHTAEGEFFRTVFWKACENLDVPVTGIRERDLDQSAQAVFGKTGPEIWRRISSMKSSIGSPWTEDQKKASLAASIVLAACGGRVQLSGARPSLTIDSV